MADSYGFQNDKTKSNQAIETMIANAVNSAVNNLQTQINGLANKFFPIGSIFYTTNNNNPGTYLGGSWESYGMGKVLVGLDPNDSNFNSIGRVGGSKTNQITPGGSVGGHVLTQNEMPAHNHAGKIRVADVEKPAYLQTVPGFGQTGGDYVVPVVDYTGQAGNPFSFSSNGGNAAHSHGFSGNAQTVNNLQPFQVVRIWRRIG